MQRILVLCADSQSSTSSETRRANIHAISGEELSKWKSSFDHVRAVGCGADFLTEDSYERWQILHDLLKPGGTIKVELFDPKYNPDNPRISFTMRSLSNIFMPIRSEAETVVLRRIESFEITTPELAAQTLRELKSFRTALNASFEKEICNIVRSKDIRLLGSGAEGSVFFHENWRRDVAIKQIKLRRVYAIEGEVRFLKNPESGAYTDDRAIIEMYTSALLHEIAGGKISNMINIHLPLFEGFFACPKNDDMFAPADVYIIMENIPSSLPSALLGVKSLKEAKVLIWQCIFTLVMLNELGWMHNDPSARNFLVRDLDENERYANQRIDDADEWVYEFRGESWVVKNIGKVVKLTDFGATTHHQDPILRTSLEDKSFRVTNEWKPAYDINYFIATLILNRTVGEDLDNYRQLFADWFGILKVPFPADWNRHVAAWQKTTKPAQSPLLEVLKYESSRPLARHDHAEVGKLLDSKFFKGAVMKL